ncbi:MAG: 16S rRNA (cytosine(1402)-N(4))-methyltransferase RsmH [Firmicutes bacterium]|nr:16S rRNA (cytosine(1402)-N(4))-methyltransferase RsmH [Bacillota bacterium]
MNFAHEPVLLQESVQALNLKPNGTYVDCTLGGAGHSLAILATDPTVRLIGIDQDPAALERAQHRLQHHKERVTLVHGNFRDITQILKELDIEKVDGILMDIGVSSPQLDEGERGFSYHHDAPLDMRMNPENPVSARDLVNGLPEDELARIIYEYGEERWAKRIAQFIAAHREAEPIETTGQLVQVIKNAVPAGARQKGPHPARRTFQALRIAVNDELGALRSALEQSLDLLNIGGRIAVITFHSLEDRIVKEFFNSCLGRCICPPELPVCVCNPTTTLKLVNSKPIVPSAAELAKNPRARSAKLRAAERV